MACGGRVASTSPVPTRMSRLWSVRELPAGTMSSCCDSPVSKARRTPSAARKIWRRLGWRQGSGSGGNCYGNCGGSFLCLFPTYLPPAV